MTSTYYDHDKAKAYCHSLKLEWNVTLAEKSDQVAANADLTQAQFDYLSRYFCDVQRWQWSPRNYGWLGRLTLAWHFIRNPKRM